MSESEQIVHQIKQRARELGFAETAICDAEPMKDAGERLLSWLGRGYQGTMHWMARTGRERADPRAFFPEAQSVIVTAFNYYRADEPLQREDHDGNISLYARGRDYHKVLRKKLRRLLADIQILLPEARGRICVDSFPIMEKALAVKAGIGWIGKHTNLIIKPQGSYFFLSEILLSEALPSDPPLSSDYCGTCNRCQTACPTGALDEAYVLDARRCISYLTIEHPGDIDPALQPGMENWVFGCDICQAVCPWNRFSSHCEETDFHNRLPDRMFALRELQQISETAFNQLFEGTPVRRAGYQNFRRNVTIAIENQENRKALEK